MIENKSHNRPYYESPFLKGGYLIVSNRVIVENKNTELVSKIIDSRVMGLALKALQESYPKHYDDIISENYDASHADIFLQLCVMGKVLYG